MSNNTTTDSSASAPETAPAAIDPRLLVREEGFLGYLTEFRRKVSGGELGSLPVVVGLAIIWVVFGLIANNFATASTFTSIFYELAATGMAALGLVFVLILGEIDLSVLSVSGLAAAIYAVLTVGEHMNAWLALLLTILAGAAIGFLQGSIFAKLGVPAFVVTLAGNLGWFGVMLYMLNTDKSTGGGTITLLPGGLNSALQETSYFMGSDIAGAYILAALGVGFFLLSSLLDAGRRRQAGIPSRATAEILVRTAGLAVLAFVVAFTLNQYQGVPNALLIFVVAVMACDLVLRRTSFGRKVFAVGGNIEAARRAGISVPKIRIAVFTIAGTFGALSGLFFAAQTNSATLDAGQGAWLMLAIASAVVGGTSLFGGRGKAWAALLGALLIQSIAVGLDLLNMQAWDQYMVTAVVVLAAVIVDSLSRRTQKSSGRG